MFRTFMLTAVLCLTAAAAQAAEYGKVAATKVADGVYLFTTAKYGDVGFGGNVVAIVSDEGVALFDSSGTPASASEILRQLRGFTPQPVRYLINSHWHWDHWGGNQAVKEEFPGVQIVAHEKTRETMEKIGIPWNAPGLEHDLPNYLEFKKKKLAEAEAKHAPEAAEMRDLLRADEDFLAQKRSVHYTFPNLTFTDALKLEMGNRVIEVHHARAITPSDTYVYLPKEKILITGDLVVTPVPFAVGGTYPTDWIAALEKLEGLSPAIVIPGHGEAQKGTTTLASHRKLMETVQADVKAAREKGLSLDDTTKQLDADAARYASMIGLKEESVGTFKGYFLEVFIRRAYREMEHPLGDEPVSKD